MRKLIVSEFLTLDGVMQAPGGSEEDRSEGFEHGGWQMPYFDEVFEKVIIDGLSGAGGFILGRKTYDIFAAYWPNASAEEHVIAGPLNNLPKYVASRTLREPLAWNNSTLLKGDVAAEVAKLKQGSGKYLQVIGSGNLAQTLMKHDLIDEYSLVIHPLVLGKGKRLFGEGAGKQALTLLESQTSTKGVMILRFKPEGK